MKFNTKTVHAGVEPDPSTGAIMTPIFQTSTYVQEAPGKHKGYEYARTQNPTRDALQKSLATLENCSHGFCFGSGLAATDTILKLLKPGDTVLAGSDLYGGTYRIFTKVFAKYGINFRFGTLHDHNEIDALLNNEISLVWVETPSNPTLKITDIKLLASKCKARNALLVVDNTFATPYLQNPIDLGADIVMHSVTKYLGGHSDVVMGFLGTNHQVIGEQIAFLQNSCGAVPGPQDCFLVLRGIKTLHLRMERHCQNAMIIADFLEKHPKVASVYYPGLASGKGHEIAKKQMRGFGGMISFTLKDDKQETAVNFLSATKLFSLAESLGGVESLIGHPASMTHASIPKEERLKVGLSDSLIRLSVGVEDAEDLVYDLQQAFNLIT